MEPIIPGYLVQVDKVKKGGYLPANEFPRENDPKTEEAYERCDCRYDYHQFLLPSRF
jgi:hypothetical protein